MNFPVISINNPPTNLSFKAAEPKIKYSNLKKVKDVPCACCGRKVIVPEVFNSVYSAITRPLLSILKDKQSPLNLWKKNPAVWGFLEKSAQENPKQSLDKIIQDKNNSYLFNKILDDVVMDNFQQGKTNNIKLSHEKLYNDIIYKSRAKMRSSSAVMKRLASLKKYLDGTQLETFEQLEMYSRKYPRKTLTEIINLPEVYKFHSQKDLLQRIETEEKIDYRFENIREIVKKVNPDAVEDFDFLKEDALEIFATIKDPKIRMSEIKRLYQEALTEHNCEKLTKKVHNEIDNMPTTYNTKDSFFVFARDNNYKDGQIISSIFGNLASTFEHVVPKSAAGEDKMENGLVLHWTCNQNRGNIPYTQFFEYHPEMPKNIQKQVNYIAKRILNGSLGEGFSFWPMDIARTLHKYTGGLISLDMTKHCEKGLQKLQEKVDARNLLINKLKGDYDSKLIQKLELQKQLKALDLDMKSINAMSKDLEEQNKGEAKLKSSYKSHIRIQKKINSKPE